MRKAKTYRKMSAKITAKTKRAFIATKAVCYPAKLNMLRNQYKTRKKLFQEPVVQKAEFKNSQLFKPEFMVGALVKK